MSTGGSAASWTLWPANSLAAIFDFAASSNRRALAVLAIVSLIAFVPGIFQIPPVDRDEARFAQATKQMIETGDYVDIRFQDEVRYKKPVGIYWLQAAVVKTAEAVGIPRARTRISLYRIPSLVGALGAVLATYWCALAFVGRRGAALAALMMLGSTLLGVEARLAKTDAMLLLAVVAAMGVLARVYLFPRTGGTTQRDWALVAVFWTALAAGILLKGPVILMIVGLTAAALSIFDRSARWLMALRPLPGIIWLLVLVLPWFLAIYARAGGTFFTNAVGHDLLDKVAGGQESHGAPPGLYFILFFATFFPASILAGLAAPAVWAVRREPAARFLLAWLLPSWIVFELIPTKLPHYVLPLYPAVAILIAAAVETKVLSRQRWQVRGVMWWFLAPIIAGITAIIAAIVVERSLVLGAWPLFGIAIACGLLASQLYEEDGAERALTRAAAGWVLVAIAVYGIVVPALGPLFPSVALERVLRRSGCAHPLAASAGYDEPSLVFLAGTGTRLTDPSGAADFLREGGCRFAFVTVRQERAFALRAEAIGLRYERGPRVEAFNVTHGQPLNIAVFRSVQDAQ
jgi:4-amino-4-deoxy-L-arabinose transferase-like glycosyltransferase